MLHAPDVVAGFPFLPRRILFRYGANVGPFPGAGAVGGVFTGGLEGDKHVVGEE